MNFNIKIQNETITAVKLANHNALYNCIDSIVISFLELGHILTQVEEHVHFHQPAG